MIEEPSTHKQTLDRLYAKLVWRVFKFIQDPRIREQLSKVVVEVHQETLSKEMPTQGDVPSGWFETLNDSGLLMLPPVLSAEKIAEVVHYLNGLKWGDKEGSVIYFLPSDVLRVPHVLDVALNPQILSTVQKFFGMPGTIVDIAAWRSFVPREEDKKVGAQKFHRDRNDFKWCKLFIYLDDVGPDNGPHVFVKGSHSLQTAAPAFEKRNLSFDKMGPFFVGDGRHVGGEVSDVFGDNVVEVIGPPGTTFLENTYGFHRGKAPVTGMRTLLQVIYTMMPYPNAPEKYQSVTRPPIPSSFLGDELSEFALRFLITLPEAN